MRTLRLLGAAGLVGAWACATEETVTFGDPERVAGGTQTVVSSSTSGVTCAPNPLCAVSWADDVYAGILAAPVGGATPSGACAATNCHREEQGDFQFDGKDSDVAYAQLLSFILPKVGRYIVPCEPTQSAMMCNLRFEADAVNPYAANGPCGSLMPKLLSISPVKKPLSQAQLDTIAEWIECGAPLN
ncbi:MAG: hypothetical protein EXR75_12795 [Myxococcales bacterium]|nr:hypothetical protein [Myxococcales bacterium]